uniref:Secreted protein n=1 Tax=Schistosoma curassoni TaxID=6186 RepID=A0A183KQR5_9TREM
MQLVVMVLLLLLLPLLLLLLLVISIPFSKLFDRLSLVLLLSSVGDTVEVCVN